MMKEQVEKILCNLSEREREVLEMRYGLVDGRERTLEEIGTMYHVTRERIRQIASWRITDSRTGLSVIMAEGPVFSHQAGKSRNR